MKCQWFYRPAECQHESLGTDPGSTHHHALLHRRPLLSPKTAYARPGREFMHLHPQEVFLTIHDDPNPISTIVSGAAPLPRLLFESMTYRLLPMLLLLSNKVSLSTALQSGKPTVIDFFADW